MPTYIKLKCNYCNSNFKRTLKDASSPRSKNAKNVYCSKKCKYSDGIKKQNVKCINCKKIFSKKRSEIKRTNNNFCSKSCAATYNNKNKTYGIRRSKLEKWLEIQLKSLYNFKIYFNSKKIIGSELDIFIPSLSLAFEINGPTHYYPIYGEKKFKQIQKNDQLKRKICRSKNIKFRSINVSKLKYFSVKKSQKYLNQIIKTILK